MDQELVRLFDELRRQSLFERDFRPVEFVRERLRAGKLEIPAAARPAFVSELVRLSNYDVLAAPQVLLDTVGLLLQGRNVTIACDPWAGLGILGAHLHAATQAEMTHAISSRKQDFALGQMLVPELDWILKDPVDALDALPSTVDAIASVLPFNAKTGKSRILHSASGVPVEIADDCAWMILTASSLRLSPDGVAIFVVAPSFFFRTDSVLHKLGQLGLGIEAALALPAGTFAPHTNIVTYIIVLRKTTCDTMFVAQLAHDRNTNIEIIENFRQRRADGPFELGRYVAPTSFRGLEPLRLEEQLQNAERRFEIQPISLGDVASDIRLGRPQPEFEFPAAENALFIPLIGNSDVVDDPDALTLKKHNYAQIAIDPDRSHARFVARFLNSELGRTIRDAHKSGSTIAKLNSSGLRQMQLLVPPLTTQRKILAVDQQLVNERAILRGLQNDLRSVERDLWSLSSDIEEVGDRLGALSTRLAGAGPHVAWTLDQWFETLPFPLASILRAWQATPSDDFKTKCEHLLHFFEAAAQFVSVIYLSAFISQPSFFERHREKLIEAWAKQGLSLERPTFATWRIANEYLSKQTRQLVNGDEEGRLLAGELFADPNLALARMLSRKDLATILATTNKMRNDWSGHGGIVSADDARHRNQLLLEELQKLRETMADGWKSVRLVRALHCKPRGGLFENEVALLIGSNTEFLKEPRTMTMWLDIDQLYLVSENANRALQLLPLIFVGASPPSAKNACYFFNRVDREGIRFVSYHFADRAELREQFADASAAIKSLTSPSGLADGPRQPPSH